MTTITIPKKEYQDLRAKALAFERYFKKSVQDFHLQELEKDLKVTKLYKNKFVKSISASEQDHLEGNIREIDSLKEIM